MEDVMMAPVSQPTALALCPPDEASDEALMAAYAADEPSAFARLLPRFADRLWGYFAKAFRDHAVADDLYQTTLLKLHGARKRYLVGAPFRPWLFGIAARVRADELRRRYRQSEAPEVARALIQQPLDPESHVRDRKVRDALAALPESQREVVMLHRYAGLSFAEIGVMLAETEGAAVAEGAVRARAFRAYAVLREALRDWAPEGREAPRAGTKRTSKTEVKP